MQNKYYGKQSHETHVNSAYTLIQHSHFLYLLTSYYKLVAVAARTARERGHCPRALSKVGNGGGGAFSYQYESR